MTAPLRAGVLVTRRYPGYKDIPGVHYHYPKANYQRSIEKLIGSLVVFYEPRRGGVSAESQTGGRSAFIGAAFIDRCWDDPEDSTHGYVGFRYTIDFNAPVPISTTGVSGNSLQSAVLEIPYAIASNIVAVGLAIPLFDISAEAREGLSDVTALSDLTARPIEQVIRNQRVRDQSFHYRVVEKVYMGKCALTGIRMTNGKGRAEADAAHIRPVANDGPDTVRNGIALMKSMHWAFDRGLVALANDGRILTAEKGLEDSVRGLLRPDGYAILPQAFDERPHSAFLQWHRENVFKGAV